MLRYKKIFLGNKCDNKCLYCPYRSGDLSQPDLNTVITSINNTCSPPHPSRSEEGQKEVDVNSLPPLKEDGMVLYGGEPALRKDLTDIIRAAAGNGYRRIKLITNGRALSDMHFLRQIMDAGCHLFEIKMWGSHPDLHDYLTQVKGSFMETIRGLENLTGVRAEKCICIRIPVCRENYSDVENTVALALGFGINRIILSFQDHGLAFSQAMPHITNAVNISIFNRVWILTEGLPFCLMNGLEQHISEIYSRWVTIYERTFAHHQYCRDCIYNELCPGVEERYLEQFSAKGFSPVTANKHFQDIKALYE